jgi:thioredoxin 1
MKFNVMSIPTLLVFDGGDVTKRLIGARSKGALLQELDEFLVSSH